MLCLIALKIGKNFERKLTCTFKNDMRNLANFHQSMFTGEFYVMTMKNGSKLEEELTCQFKIDMRSLTNFDPSTRKSQKFEP